MANPMRYHLTFAALCILSSALLGHMTGRALSKALRPPECSRASSIALALEAPETLRAPVYGDFDTANHYRLAKARYNTCGTWSTE